MELKVKKIDHNLPDFEKIKKGDWVDLRVSSIFTADKDKLDWLMGGAVLNENKHYFIKLGFSCQLPVGYEAYILPRSSLFKRTGLLLTNSCGVIDCSYNGDNDEWIASVYSTRVCSIDRYDRLFQFRIQESMPDIAFIYCDTLGNEDRGGFGSTGK